MDNKELQKTINPIYLTAKATLSLLNEVKDPDAVALMQYIGLETNLQERAKTIPPSRPNHPVSIRDVGDRWASCAS